MRHVGVYPGSFNPPTVAHLAIARAARDHADLSRVDLAVSRVALGKGQPDHATFNDRLRVLKAVVAARPWLGLVVSDAQLLADIAVGYDVLVLGADKWAQVVDPRWYGDSEVARDEAVARLPKVLLAPRPPLFPSPFPTVELLEGIGHLEAISSTAARSGHREWMAPEAAAFDRETGAWSDPARYARRLGESAVSQ